MNESGGGGGDDDENINDGIQGQQSLCDAMLSNILSELDVPSDELRTTTIQNLMLQIKLYSTKEPTNPKYDSCSEINKITDKLWNHLMTGLPTFDDQLLCATCFYTVLNITQITTKKLYMDKVIQVIQSELIRKENGTATDSETTKAIALIYGLFQSNFLTYTDDNALAFEEDLNLKTVTKTMIKLLISMAYEYSKFTYITFKTLSSFEKIRGLPAQNLIFDKETCNDLLIMINHNWENPITGVRDLNKKVLYTCLSAITSHEDMKFGAYYTRFPYQLPYYEDMDDMTKTFLLDVTDFEWNKAKYLMGAEMIKASFAKTSFNDGVSSLKKPGVVAAGADLYYVILERTETIEDWCWRYLEKIAEILEGPSEKAIENFTDYWCIPTLKKFPSVLNMLIDKLGAIDTDNKLLSLLSLYKQAIKVGLINDYKSSMIGDKGTYITEGLNHCNTKVRMLAFEILCTTQHKEMPDIIQYDLIMYYLKTNINSDCRVLRINMLKSFSIFLVHLHEVYRGKVKNKQPYNEEELFQFCSNYQELVASSLEMNGNYQRKVTCIELIDTFLNNLTNVQRKRKEQTKVESSIVNALECKGLLIFMTEEFIQTLKKLTNDPSEDIRENTNKLLLKYYVDHLKKPEVINNIINEALKCMSSKFFYEISCGHSKFDLIIDDLIQNSVSEATFRSVEDIFDFAFNNLMSEYKLGRGIVESIEKGKQIHSYITLLCAVFQKCQENNHHIQISPDQFLELLHVLRGISSQFVWEQTDSTSSDFAKMNEMVEDVINKSGYGTNETDETKLSGMHQIVLNCLWLNVKASCELSCVVIQYQKHEDSRAICESALTTITRVLETCRHKGAIEAAGVALGKAIRHLTSLKSPLSSLPMQWLQNKMRELVSQSSAMASVTRRGAGLSIMLHRAVSSDSRKDKPLFQYFMNTILEACNEAEIPSQPEEKVSNILESEPMNEDKDTGKDIPKAIDIKHEPQMKRRKSIIENTEVELINENTQEKATNTEAKPTYMEVEPTNTEIKRTNTEAKPTNTEIKPTNMEIKPTNTEAKPTYMEVEPTNTEIQRTNTEAKPTNTEIKPTNTEIIPTNMEVETTNTEIKPTNMEIKPTYTEAKPTNTEIKPTEGETANTEVKSIKYTEKYRKEETGKDIPKAVYIHFLTRIVTDSSLTCDVMYYSANIAQLAFGNLTSPHWQIRNAALQLYGALLPKLIGQKKSASEDQPFATVGCDELRTHSPTLWNYMMQRLNNETFHDEIQYHSSLVPILNVLANCAKRYNLYIDLQKQEEKDVKLLQSLVRLLESPIHTVRKLTAKAIYNIASYLGLQNIVIGVPHNLDENAINGRLILLGYYMQYDVHSARNSSLPYSIYEQSMYSKDGPYGNYNDQDKRSRSYVNKQQLLEASGMTPNIEKTWEELLEHFYAPGVEAWAKKSFEKSLSLPSWKDVPMFLITVMKFIDLKAQPQKQHPHPNNQQDFQGFDGEAYLEIVLQKVEKTEYVPDKYIEVICKILLENTKNASYATWKMLYEIVKQIDPQEISHIEGITNAFNKDTKVCYKTRYVVPFAARIVQVLGDITALTRITDIILSWTDADTTDSDLRYIAALAVNELANNFKDLPDELKITVIKSAVLLLQDEDENVRNTSAVFYKNLVKCETLLQPYICLLKLLDFNFLTTILSIEIIQDLCKQLTELVNNLSTPKEVDEYNPFSNDASNIYLETDVLKQLICAVEATLSSPT